MVDSIAQKAHKAVSIRNLFSELDLNTSEWRRTLNMTFTLVSMCTGLEASADALGRSIQQGARARFGAGARQLQVRMASACLSVG